MPKLPQRTIVQKLALDNGTVYNVHIHQETYVKGFYGFLVCDGEYITRIETQGSVQEVIEKAEEFIFAMYGDMVGRIARR